MSTLFLKDPKVARLTDRHGNDAVAVVLALMAEAMVQERGGTVVLPYRQLANDANTDRETAIEIVASAVEVQLLTQEGGDDFEFEVSFPAWSRHQAAFRKAKSRAAQKPTDEADVTPSHEQVTPSHKKSPTGQDKTRQERTREESSGVPPADAPLSHLLADLIAENDPNGKRPTVTARWRTEEDRLIRLDGRKPEEAERLIRWTQANTFWRGNVLSMPKFRDQYGRLYSAAIAESEKKRGRDPAPGMTQAEKRAEQIRKKREMRAAA